MHSIEIVGSIVADNSWSQTAFLTYFVSWNRTWFTSATVSTKARLGNPQLWQPSSFPVLAKNMSTPKIYQQIIAVRSRLLRKTWSMLLSIGLLFCSRCHGQLHSGLNYYQHPNYRNIVSEVRTSKHFIHHAHSNLNHISSFGRTGLEIHE